MSKPSHFFRMAFPSRLPAFIILWLPLMLSAWGASFREWSAAPDVEAVLADTTIKASICAGETYAFNGQSLDSAGTYQANLTGVGGNDSLVTLILDVFPTDTTELFVRICEGSVYVFGGDTLNTSGIYLDTLSNANGCDSTIVLHLEAVSFFETNLLTTICAGDTLLFGNDTLTLPGVYTDTLTAAGGCDSIVTLDLKVAPAVTSFIEASICANQTFIFNGDTLDQSGEYTAVLSTQAGCDSIVTLQLTVLPTYQTAIEAIICDGETYDYFGQLLDSAGVYEYTYAAASGCDSIVLLTLTVLPNSTDSLSATICQGEVFELNGTLYTETGVYTQELNSANGCDSTLVLTLTVTPKEMTALQATICAGEAYVFNGDTLTTSGSYVAALTSAAGCDSTVVLALTVLPENGSELSAVICGNETYPFNGQLLDSSGTYVTLLTDVNGCDSTVTLQLTVLPLSNSEIAAVICEGEAFDFNGQLLDEPGVYEFTYADVNGCDSTVVVQLEVLPAPVTLFDVTLCDGETYDFNGETYDQTGVYTFDYSAVNGCDSTVVLNINVLPAIATNLEVRICEGSTYEFDGQTLSVAGTYNATFTAANGCDSLVTLTLNTVTAFENNLAVAICSGESYEFNGEILTEPGIYTDTLTAAGGCDSILVLQLSVLPGSVSNVSAQICANETYAFNGETYNQTGVYTAILSNANGCDSIVTLTLTVFPTYSTAFSAAICEGATYTFNNEILSAAGEYTFNLQTANGCDSIITLSLEVLPGAVTTIAATICEGDAYPFNGAIYSVAGQYTSVLNGPNGCDSTVILNLSVAPAYQSALNATICAGETLTFGNQVLSAEGVYEFNFPTVNGCDSIILLSLEVLEPVITYLSAATCEGAAYVFDGETLTESGEYTFEYTAASGCDSTVVLNLTVNAPIEILEIQALVCPGETFEFGGVLLTAPGVYSFTYEAASGCDSTVLVSLGVIEIDTQVSLSGITLSASAVNASYQWLDCATQQPIAGATGATFTPSVSGSYAVQITTLDGCTAVSECTDVTVVGTNAPANAPMWSMAPNPALHTTQLLIPHTLESDWELQVSDASGRILRREILPQGVQQHTLDLEGLPAGALLVRLTNGQYSTVKQLVKISD